MNQVLFDVEKIKRNHARAINSMDDHGFLFDNAINRMIDNLKDIQRDFKNILIIGKRGSQSLVKFLDHYDAIITLFDVVDGDNEIPAFKSESFDCILCLPYMHTVNDVPQFLMAIKSYLKPDGVFMNCFFGGQSLQELRQSIMSVELSERGGVGQHVHPMIDHYDYAALMQKANFALPVVDYDRFVVEYSSIQKLYDDLYYMGEGNALANRNNTITELKSMIERHYKDHFYNDGFVATFDIIHGLGWKSDPSQQLPAKRGSGQKSMTEIL
jgi:NADH dehydrogenase [ubiquinone] 1 alpha subcomplex assembly factor 5